MILIAVANGGLREAWLLPQFGEHAARQVSTLLLIVLFAIYIGAVSRIWPIRSSGEALTIGALWLALTLAFEFGAGRLWVLVPIWVAVAPYVFYQLWRSD
jgi:hypothetical protein